MKGGGGLAVILAKAKDKMKPSEDEGEEMAMDSEEEGDEGDNPVDLFLESIGQEPTPDARKAFKLAVQSCYGEE